jgi:hypothetical protein
MSNPLNKPNYKDPCVSQDDLKVTILLSSNEVQERVRSCVRKQNITHLDLLFLEEHTRKLNCAIQGLLHSVTHDKPLNLL